MGGTIWVESNAHIAGEPPGDWSKDQQRECLGTIFYFTLQLKVASSREILSQQFPAIAQQHEIQDVQDIKILLAEDGIVNQKVAILILKKLGYHADIVSNGVEVLERLEQQDYDVILMDIQMPEMDGLTATRLIRQSDKKQPHIIALTANVLEKDRQLCMEAGMNNFIHKPIIIEELDNVLSQFYLK